MYIHKDEEERLLFFGERRKKKYKEKKNTLSYWKDLVRYYWERLVLHIAVYFFVVFALLFVCLLSQLCFLLNEKNVWMVCISRKGENQICVILFVRFRIPHIFIHITVTSLTFKPSFVRGLSNPHIGLRPYLEKLKIRVETCYTVNTI